MAAPGITLIATYDYRLVILSIFITIFGSYIALDLAGKISGIQGWANQLWLAGAAMTLGISIWAMHYVAMLAYQLPIPIAYDFTIVIASMCLSISGSVAGILTVSREQPLQRLSLTLGALYVGLGIVGLHMSAMESLRVAAVRFYDPIPMLLSIATAIIGSGIALWLTFSVRQEGLGKEIARQTGSVLSMATAIIGMHYLAMAAVSYQHTERVTSQIPPATNNAQLAVLIGVGTLVILVLTLFASFFGQRSSAQRAEARVLRQSEERFRVLVQNASDIIVILTEDGTISYLSRSAQRILNCNPETLLGSKVIQFVHPEERFKAESFLEIIRCSPYERTEEFRLQHADETWRDFEVTASNLLTNPAIAGIVATCHDITERKQTEQQLFQNAFYDTLTGLPNRVLFMTLLEHALEYSQRYNDYLFAVLFLDIDRFKLINDSLGHTNGDRLLIAIAQRIESCLRETDTAARLGGDEFTILLEDVGEVCNPIRFTKHLQEQLSLPFVVDRQEVYIQASIGIVLNTIPYSRPEDILRDADIAMYRAKALGKGRYEMFNTDMLTTALARLQLEQELRQAFARQEFCVYYQPIVALATGNIAGFEALVRWQHPQRGVLSPAQFVFIAEEMGLMADIDRWVLRQACQQIRLWQEQFSLLSCLDNRLTINVNLSTSLLGQLDLLEQVRNILAATHFDACCLKLEITENIIMANEIAVMTALSQLRELGIRLAIDDFGTGYSSLGRLHRFPIDGLKIDRSFISGFGAGRSNLEIAETIITLGRKLEVSVTAEGIETAAQLAQLQQYHCNYGQGYFFSQPLSSHAAASLIAAQPHW